ncbi:MAG: twitch domain-containing radical SAM protein [Rhodocyclaceae bacterium]
MKTESVYCAAPWNHAHLRADGFFSVCCRALRGGLSIPAQSIDEYWNGEEMRKLRLDMLNHRPPDAICRNCVENKTTVNPGRLAYNELSRDEMDDILARTGEDGSTTFEPVSLDIRTNFCNLKCRICSPGSSSSILTEYKQLGFPLPRMGPNAQKEGDIDFSDALLSKLRKISWAGGEPFMSPVHWKLMESLKRLGNTNLFVWYNSNFSFPGGTLSKAKDLLASFSNVHMGASIDAVGEDFEYLRYLASYEETTSNLVALKAAVPGVNIAIDYTATSLGLLSLKDVVQFCLANGIGLKCKVANVADWDWLGIGCLRSDVMEAALAEAQAASQGTALEATILQFTAFAHRKYQVKVPDLGRCRAMEKSRGASGYLEARIGHQLNRG